MYKSRNIIKTRDGVSVGASAVDTDVSAPFNVEDPSNISVTVVLSAISVTNGITFSLKDSFDDGTTWFGVGSESNSASVKKTFAGDTDVAPATDTITSTAHGFLTGSRVYLHANGGTLPTGLSAGTYYVIKVDADNLKLASTQALALAGTAVDITADGTGTNALYQTVYEIRMVANDSSDYAQLPLQAQCKVVANSGASDSCTVSAVYMSR